MIERMKEYKYKINGNPYTVVINEMEDTVAHVEVNGTSYKVEFEKPEPEEPKKVERPIVATKPASVPKVAPAAKAAKKDGVKSPLPGIILEIKVKVGDTIKKGQTVIILEAMKMENNITADKDGKVTAINVNCGDSVLEGTDLVIIE